MPNGDRLRRFAFEDLILQPGDCVSMSDAVFTSQEYGPVLVIAVWAKAYQEPIYLVTNMDSVDEACHWYSNDFALKLSSLNRQIVAASSTRVTSQTPRGLRAC